MSGDHTHLGIKSIPTSTIDPLTPLLAEMLAAFRFFGQIWAWIFFLNTNSFNFPVLQSKTPDLGFLNPSSCHLSPVGQVQPWRCSLLAPRKRDDDFTIQLARNIYSSCCLLIYITVGRTFSLLHVLHIFTCFLCKLITLSFLLFHSRSK